MQEDEKQHVNTYKQSEHSEKSKHIQPQLKGLEKLVRMHFCFLVNRLTWFDWYLHADNFHAGTAEWAAVFETPSSSSGLVNRIKVQRKAIYCHLLNTFTYNT